VLIAEPRLAKDDLGAGARERRRWRPELFDDGVLPSNHRRPVELDRAGCRPEPRGVLHEPVNPS
jgi:hypothetical protein